MTLTQIRKLVRETDKAVKTVARNRALMETYLSIMDYKARRVIEFTSARAITRAAKRIK